MRSILLLQLIVFFGLSASSQTTKQFNSSAYVTLAFENGHIHFGGNHDLHLAKFNNWGGLDWAYSYSSQFINGSCYAGTVDNDGNIFTLSHDGSGTDAYSVVKVGASGNFESAVNLYSSNNSDWEYFRSQITTDNEGNVLVVLSLSPATEVIKLNSNLEVLWQKRFAHSVGGLDGYMKNPAFSIEADSNNDIIISGKLDHKITVTKLSSIGDVIWSSTIGEGEDIYNQPHRLKPMDSGLTLVAGVRENISDNTHGIFVESVQESGEIAWFKFVAASEVSMYVESIMELPNGNVLIHVPGQPISRLIEFTQTGELINTIQIDGYTTSASMSGQVLTVGEVSKFSRMIFDGPLACGFHDTLDLTTQSIKFSPDSISGYAEIADVLSVNEGFSAERSSMNYSIEYLCGDSEDDALLGVERMEQRLNLIIHPVPCFGSMTVSGLRSSEKINVSITDLSGMQVKSFEARPFDEQLELDVSDLPASVYSLSVTSEKSGVTTTSRFVKM